MKKYLLASAGALALTMAAAAANAQEVTTGFVGLNYSNIDIGAVGSATLIEGQGTASFSLSDSWEVQLDGSLGTLNPPGSGGSSTLWGTTGHLFYDSEAFKGGVFVGYQDLGDSLGTDGNTFGYGLEGRWAASDAFTIGGVAAWGTIELDGAPDIDLNAYRGEISVFSSDNLRWDASYTHTEAEWGPFSEDSNIWAVGAEWQMADNPYSFTFGYSSASGLSSRRDANTWSVGVRRTFGGSLKDRDRTSSPFLGLPFAFGGFGGIASANISVFDRVFHCFAVDSDECPDNDDAIDAWLDQFDDDDAFLEELLCAYFDCDDED